ncbi:hypothetical protein AOLI_G00000830 [Acnodon oligacanthus]
MRLAVLQFIAGFCGALGSIFLLLSLGTDYWLLASESCDPGDEITARLWRSTTEDGLQEDKDGPERAVLAYHEGVFWRCSYMKEMDREEDSMLDFWISLLVFLVVGTFAAWVQGSSTLEQYVLQRRLSVCPSLHLSVHYGLSFMLAPAASFFCLLCGLLILLTQTASRAESASAAREPPSVQEGWQVSTL